MSEKTSRGKKREITEEEISRYIDQGYYFRVKEVNGIKYITRRKGREEKGMGRYTEEVWSMIQRARSQTRAPRHWMHTQEQAYGRIILRRAR